MAWEFTSEVRRDSYATLHWRLGYAAWVPLCGPTSTISDRRIHASLASPRPTDRSHRPLPVRAISSALSNPSLRPDSQW